MSVAILWLRNDLRLADNPALALALAAGERVVPVFVHAPAKAGAWAPGAASRWWLHHSLAALDRALRAAGSRLVVRRGPSAGALRDLAREAGARAVYWNRRYEPALVESDRAVKAALAAEGIACESVNGSLLVEPWGVRTGAGDPFRVFTPFWRACQKVLPQEAPLPPPQALPPVPEGLDSIALDALGLLPGIPWDSGLASAWQPGATGALAQAERFLDGPVTAYKARRDYPAEPATSRLSPHLHFGEIGPRQLAWALRSRSGMPRAGHGAGSPWSAEESGAEAYLRELGWREFGHHVLFHFPHTAEAPLDRRFEAFPWRREYGALLTAWQQGRTGVPLVDAGMRELWETGWMHNRVRMVVASFLTKNLRIPWQEGARWFWDTLVDADLANNTLGWQWASGCGADAAPYFRIFNPVLQGERFDPAGAYVRRWAPELARVPDPWLHHPWEAPAAVLAEAGVRLGADYPAPVVDLKESREEALAAYRAVTGNEGRRVSPR
jgi:deoxyribodipyrimidine photo-lyase